MIENNSDPAERIAKFIAEIAYEDLPPTVIDSAKKSMLDTLAVALAGSSQGGISETLDLALAIGGMEEATVWVSGERLPASQAAFVNGPMARALDMGDVHEEAGHVGEYILPALLAAAELREQRGNPVSGKELITAYTVGAEVLARVGLSCKAITTAVREHKNPQMGTFGATAAVAKILNTDIETTWNAIGIGYSAMGNFDSQANFDGSLMQRVHHAFVCRDAILAVQMAERGINGPKNIFTGLGNFYRIYYPNFSDLSRLTSDLGTVWEFSNGTMIKPYMCCKCFHAAMYSLRLLMDEEGITHDQIDEIHVQAPPMDFFSVPNYRPVNFVQRQMSAPWCIATVAVDGELFIDAYQEPSRQPVLDLAQKIHFDTNEEYSCWVGAISVKAKGREMHKHIAHCIGHPENPVNWEWLQNKLSSCSRHATRAFDENRQADLLQMIRSLESVHNCRSLVDVLTP